MLVIQACKLLVTHEGSPSSTVWCANTRTIRTRRTPKFHGAMNHESGIVDVLACRMPKLRGACQPTYLVPTMLMTHLLPPLLPFLPLPIHAAQCLVAHVLFTSSLCASSQLHTVLHCTALY